MREFIKIQHKQLNFPFHSPSSKSLKVHPSNELALWMFWLKNHDNILTRENDDDQSVKDIKRDKTSTRIRMICVGKLNHEHLQFHRTMTLFLMLTFAWFKDQNKKKAKEFRFRSRIMNFRVGSFGWNFLWRNKKVMK